MTEALRAAIETAIAEVAAIDDPIERYHCARKLRAELADGDLNARQLQRRSVGEVREGRSWREVGDLLGVSGSRAEQIAKGR